MDLDDLNVENAYFRSFDAIVRRQLDPVWHKVGPRTKQLVSDLATLRRLLTYVPPTPSQLYPDRQIVNVELIISFVRLTNRYLLTYDPLAFHSYLETIIASNSISAAGNARHNQSPWLLTDAAHIIFSSAKRRCYTLDQITSSSANASPQPRVEDELDDEEGWNALDEMEFGRLNQTDNVRGAKGKGKAKRPRWLPKGMEPVLEELPKWNLLADVLKEIEDEIMRQESLSSGRLPHFPPSSQSLMAFVFRCTWL